MPNPTEFMFLKADIKERFMAEVFHVKNPTFGISASKAEFPQDYVLVAEIKSDDLEEIFELTNTIEEPWWVSPRVVATFPGSGGCRSTSVGDVVKMDDGKVMRCEGFGWKELE